MNKLFPFLCILILCRSVFAQNSYDELLHLSYDYIELAKFKNTNVNLSQQHLNFSGGYGFRLNDKEDLLNVGLSYEWLELKTNDINQQDLVIQNTGIGLEWLKHWKNPSWASTFSAGIGAVSDYKTDVNSAYQTSLMTMFHYGKFNDLIWTFGALYSDQPFGSWVFPILGVDWRATERLYLSTILFSHTYLEYALKPKVWYTGIDVREMGMSFVVSDYQGAKDSYITSLSPSFPYYPYAVTVFNDFYLKEYISVFLKTGVLLSRKNEHFTSNHKNLSGSIYNNSIQPSFYLRTGIALRFRKF